MEDAAFSKIITKNRNNWTKAEICIYELWSDVLGKEYISIEAAEYVAALEAVAEAAKQVDFHKKFLPKGTGFLEDAIYGLSSTLAALRKAQE